MRQQLNGKKELKLSGGVVVECHSEDLRETLPYWKIIFKL
jgi:hypothetical protein